MPGAGEVSSSESASTTSPTSWLAAGGAMDDLIRAFDWSQTPIGPMADWSPTLRTMVRFLLANRFPLLLWWGPQYVSIYNDAYRPVLGAKHPWALGKPVSECWSEIWHILRPLIDTPFHGGPATWNEDIELEINRHGFAEETHFTIAYSPVPDESAANGIGGVLATVTEITDKVVGERRILVLRNLAARTGDARTSEEACAIAAETLAKHAKDVPFALFYLLDADRKQARLAGAAGVARNLPISAELVTLKNADEGKGWHFPADGEPLVVDDLASRFASGPTDPLADPTHTAMILPIASVSPQDIAGFLVAGVSPRLKLDDRYHDFLQLMKTQVASAIANARSHQQERKRAEVLTELDRAKTVFFSNVSHEFRTPLTLMLGHIEDTLSSSGVHGSDRERLIVAYRNSLRLLKLVNTLLDFSRIEAGRMQAAFEPTDLARATAELASVFRSATEKAGLTLVRRCAAPGRTRPRRSPDVGEDRPQPAVQRLQVHLSRQHRGQASRRGRQLHPDRSGHGHRNTGA
jgi:signal transduction histidine kinase